MKGPVLPIHEVSQDIVSALDGKDDSRLVLEAPTGSGKSTQVPQILLDNGIAGKGQVIVLQPRRIAARMLSRRVAAERGGRVGDEIGFQVRFERRAGVNTRVCYVTEGVLLRRLLEDPCLNGVGALVFDEFHERHIQGDVMLAMALSMQKTVRPDLKIVVMSATLDSGKLEAHLSPCCVVRSEGKTYPVRISYVSGGYGQGKQIWDHVALALKKEVIAKKLPGDILVFLPGAYEIRRTMAELRKIPELNGVDVRPLYGQLSPADQDAAILPGNGRKVVLATNVAETSLTIDGVRIVIDSGLARIAAFDPRRGINTLRVEKISRASAEQRSGRAGRTSSGVCIRLWTERDHGSRPSAIAPEVNRLDLCETLLGLKAAGIERVEDMEWLDVPDALSLERGLQLLKDLGAIDREEGRLTDVGRRMVAFPAHPRYSRMLVEAERYGCLVVAALCVALCQERSLFVSNDRKLVEDFSGRDDFSDFLPLIRAWGFAYRAGFNASRCEPYGIKASVARDISNVMESLLGAAGITEQIDGIDEGSLDCVQLAKVILAGFSDNVARRRSLGTLSCEVVGGRRAKLGRGSLAAGGDLIVGAEITEIEGKDVNVILGKATGIELGWLNELFPEDLKKFDRCRYDALERKVVNENVLCFRDLVLNSKQSGEPDVAQAADVLAAEVVAGRLVMQGWNNKCMDWVARVSCVREHFPELELPCFDEESFRIIVAEACYGAFSYKQIKGRELWRALEKWLSPALTEAVRRLAPEKIRLDNGLETKLTYLEGEPKTSVVLQRLYGLQSTPLIGGGKIPVLIEILGPNHRPVQRTRDMAGFWENSYPEIRKQLKGRYPKHEWR